MACLWCWLQLVALVRDVEHLLASLAMYVEQAREDEVDRVSDQSRSLADDIRLIEEQGIYHLLCSLQLNSVESDHGTAKSEPSTDLLEAAVARGVMLIGCSAFDHQAPVDNRNYMTFYALDRLLLRVIDHDLSRLANSPLEWD